MKHLRFLSILLLLACSAAEPPTENAIQATPTATIEADYGLNFSSGVRCVLHDSRGNYWFGSHQEGACFYDGKTFTYFTTKNGLDDNQVRTIQEDQDGNIWFGTANGVSRYAWDQSLVFSSINRIESFRGSEASAWGFSNTDLWFNAGNKTGLYRVHGDKTDFLKFPKANVNPEQGLLALTGVSKTDDKVWFATYGAAIGYDGKSFEMIDESNLDCLREGEYVHVRSILSDSKNNLWIGNNGIGVLLLQEDKIFNFSKRENIVKYHAQNNELELPQRTLEHVFAIAEDKSGNIWFGDRDMGAWKYNGDSMQNYTIGDPSKPQHIWQIYQDWNGELLFCMARGGVFKFTGTAFEQKF